MDTRKDQHDDQRHLRNGHITSHRHGLRHTQLSAVLIGRTRMVDGITMRILIGRQSPCVTKMHHACMGMDKWRHHLQDDKQPEHQ